MDPSEDGVGEPVGEESSGGEDPIDLPMPDPEGGKDDDAGDWGEPTPECEDDGQQYYVPADSGYDYPGLAELEEQGCYTPCWDGGDADCEAGTVCRTVWVDPCWNSPCAADGSEEKLCIEEDPICADAGSGYAFTISPAPGDRSSPAVVSCSVLDTPGGLDCEEPVGTVQVGFGAGPLPAAPGDPVTLRYTFVGQVEWADEWLTIEDADGKVIAGGLMATSLDGDQHWPDTIEMWSVGTGCGAQACPDGVGQFIRTAVEYDGTAVAPGESAEISVGDQTFVLATHEAREGACGPSWVDSQSAWYSVSVVAAP